MNVLNEIDEDLVERLELVRERVADIVGETTVSEKYREFFCKTAEYLVYVNSVLDMTLKGEFRTKSLDELKDINDKNFDYIRESFYETSYANPNMQWRSAVKSMDSIFVNL